MNQVVKPVHRGPLREAVQERVKQFIVDNRYTAGDALPSEADLAQVLGVSRPSLREALRVLATQGVVESRHGHGTFVGRFSLSPFVDGLSFGIRVSNPSDAARAISEMLEIRDALEQLLIRKVTPTMSGEALEALDQVVHEMEAKAEQREEFSREDRAFHEILYRDVSDTMIVHLVRAFWDVFDTLRQELPDVIGELSSIVQHHRAILEAVRDHDVERAIQALDAHFEGIRSRVGR